MPRVNPVSRPEHAHECPFCKSAWAHDGHANLCTLSTKQLGCFDCTRPERVRLRAIKAQEDRDRERMSGRENVFFQSPLNSSRPPWASLPSEKFQAYMEAEEYDCEN